MYFTFFGFKFFGFTFFGFKFFGFVFFGFTFFSFDRMHYIRKKIHGEELLNVFYIVFNSAKIYKHRFLSYLGHDFIHVHVQL